MTAFKKGEAVVSRRTGNRGMVDRIEYDEFFHTTMFRVDMGSNVYYIENRRYDGCYWWFKAQDLVPAAEWNKETAVA